MIEDADDFPALHKRIHGMIDALAVEGFKPSQILVGWKEYGIIRRHYLPIITNGNGEHPENPDAVGYTMKLEDIPVKIVPQESALAVNGKRPPQTLREHYNF